MSKQLSTAIKKLQNYINGSDTTFSQSRKKTELGTNSNELRTDVELRVVDVPEAVVVVRVVPATILVDVSGSAVVVAADVVATELSDTAGNQKQR